VKKRRREEDKRKAGRAGGPDYKRANTGARPYFAVLRVLRGYFPGKLH